MTTAAATHELTREEIQRFENEGYLGPYTAFTPEEMDAMRPEIDRILQEPHRTCVHYNGKPVEGHQGRHLDRRLIWELCSHPAIVERMAGIKGPDLVLWRSNFFVKHPGDKAIPWHQDRAYWPIKPEINITAWMAIDDVTVENSCVQIIPGSHKLPLEHVPTDKEINTFHKGANVDGVDLTKRVYMVLKPGQFFLFDETTLHHSEPNRSNKRRCGLAVRVTVPKVKVDHAELYRGHKCVLLRGEDRYGLNEMTQPPLE